jgi:hypothetical protein
MTSEQGRAMAHLGWGDHLDSMLDDYLFIGGHRMPARLAAVRMGVTKRTIERWRRELRSRGVLS